MSMPSRDEFMLEIATDMQRTYIVIGVSFVVLLAVSWVLYATIKSAIASVMRYVNRSKASTSSTMQVAMTSTADDDVEPKPEPEADEVPEGARFRQTLQARTDSADVKGFNQAAGELCAKRGSEDARAACATDAGLGGGAAAFDPANDDYARRAKSDGDGDRIFRNIDLPDAPSSKR